MTRSDKIGLIAEKYTCYIMVYIISSVGAIEILFVFYKIACINSEVVIKKPCSEK